MVKITDMSGLLPDSGRAVTISAWDKDGKQLTTSGYALPVSIYNHVTTSIPGRDLEDRFPDGAPAAYSFLVESYKMFITNVKSSSDGSINIPTVYTSGITNYTTNYVSDLNTIRITDMSGGIPAGGAITITARGGGI